MQYTIRPRREGRFTIGPAKITEHGKTYQSSKAVVNVISKPNRPPAGAPPEKQEVYCSLDADKKSAFIEEPITITLSIFHRGEEYEIKGVVPLKFPDCTVDEPEGFNEFKTERAGRTFSVIQKKILVYPSKPGKLEIFPAQVVYQVKKKQQKKRNERDNFFGLSFMTPFFEEVEQKTTVSNTLSIDVKTIPGSNNFDGIGSFYSFTAHADKTNILVNEPITLTLELKGSANFDIVMPPVLTLPPSCKSYDSKTDQTEDSKKFEFIVQFPEPGSNKIPAQAFSYFDTKIKKHKTIKTEPIEVTINGSNNGKKITININKKTNKTGEDIHFIEEEGSATKQAPFSLSLKIFLILLLLIPVFSYHKFLISKLSKKLNKLFTKERSLLIKYEEKIKACNADQIYSIMLEFLSEEKIEQKLKEKKELLEFLKECAQYSFAVSHVTEENFLELKEKAISYIKELL